MNNTGYRNTGNHNTGYYNTGYNNTGNHNTGYCNTGNYNTGHRNTGDYNTGNYNTGDLNTNTPTVRLFNKDSGIEFYSKKHNKLNDVLSKYQKKLCQWVYEKDMSEQEKKDNPIYNHTGGYLKTNGSTYNGKEVTREDREFLESLPNFCPKILEECTGIVFTKPRKKIVIDGKEIEISADSFEQLKQSLLED